MAAMYQTPESALVVPLNSDMEFKTADDKEPFCRASYAVPHGTDSIRSVCGACSVRMSPPSFCVDERAVTFVHCRNSTKGGSRDEGRGKKTYRGVQIWSYPRPDRRPEAEERAAETAVTGEDRLSVGDTLFRQKPNQCFNDSQLGAKVRERGQATGEPVS